MIVTSFTNAPQSQSLSLKPPSEGMQKRARSLLRANNFLVSNKVFNILVQLEFTAINATTISVSTTGWLVELLIVYVERGSELIMIAGCV